GETEKQNAELLTGGEAYTGEDTRGDIQNGDAVAEDTLFTDTQEELDFEETAVLHEEAAGLEDITQDEDTFGLEETYEAQDTFELENGSETDVMSELEDMTEAGDTEELGSITEAGGDGDFAAAREELFEVQPDDFMEAGIVQENTNQGKNGKFNRFRKSANKDKSEKQAERKPGAANKVFGKLTGSIKYKLVGAFIIPVILIIILGVVSYTTAKNAICKSYTESSQSTINKTADYYDLMFANVKAVATDLVNDSTMQEYYSGLYAADPVKESSTYSTLRSSLSSTTLGNKAIANVYIFGSYGKAMYTFTPQYSDTEAYQKVKNTEEGKLIDKKRTTWFSKRETLDSEAGFASYSVSFARQLVGTSKKGVGYMFFDLDVDYVTNPLTEVDMGAKSIIALIAPDNGEIVVSNYKDIEENTQYFVGQEFLTSALEAEEESGNTYVKYDGKKQLFMYSKMDDGFAVCALIPESEIVSQASKIAVVTVTVVVLAFIVALVIGGLLAANISSTIRKIMAKLELAAAGDLTVHVDIKNKDEFGTLAASTNSMIDNVKQLIEKTKNVSEKVDISVETVSESARQLLSETKEITSAIEAIEQGVVQQAEDSEDCLRQMDDLSDKINIVSENSDKIARIADETTEIVESGIVSINELKENTGSTVDITHQVIEEILKLKESSKSIGNIVAAINEIAEQTNLLSLNASIEAARAGEAGRGFAVVAAEIRKLAEQSVDSANEINKIIEDINDKTNDTVNIARKAEDVVEVQGKSLENASQVFGHIQDKFEELVSNLNNITGGIERIAGAKAQTIDSIQSISAVSEETAAASEEVTETANRQLSAVEELNNAAEDLTANSQLLSEAIDLFKV
ncbi:MAG: methyl-accepting chemotaxis protein, partial [Lachnospira sp.]|nr:methyl-accepting chemotaxis protein [Lachnospira sp.]